VCIDNTMSKLITALTLTSMIYNIMTTVDGVKLTLFVLYLFAQANIHNFPTKIEVKRCALMVHTG